MGNYLNSLFGKKNRIVATASILWGCFFSMILINQWAYFWHRSLKIQLFLLALIVAVSASLFSLPLKKINQFLSAMGKKQKTRLIFRSSIISIVSMVLLISFFPFMLLPPYNKVVHTLQISSLDNKNPLSISSEVKLKELIINGNNVRLDSIGQWGNWSTEEGVLHSRDQAVLTYDFKARMESIVEILFEGDPTSGWAKISYDNQEPIILDLYDAKTNDVIYSPPPFSLY